MQLLGQAFEYELARRGAQAQRARRHLGRHRQRRRVRAARQARRRGVHALAARPDEPVPAGADVQPAGRRTSTTSRSKACSTTARTWSRRSRPTSRSSSASAIGTVNSINWARLVAQVVYYFAGYFQATHERRRAGRLRRADRQLRQHLRRPHRPADGPADPPAGARHQRERRPRRVLPHRPLPRAQRRPRRTRPRARRWTSPRPRTSSASSSMRSAAMRRAPARSSPRSSTRREFTLDAERERARLPAFGFGQRPQHRRRPPGDDPPRARALGEVIDPHTADALKVAREHAEAGDADGRARDRAGGQVRRDHPRGDRQRRRRGRRASPASRRCRGGS